MECAGWGGGEKGGGGGISIEMTKDGGKGLKIKEIKNIFKVAHVLYMINMYCSSALQNNCNSVLHFLKIVSPNLTLLLDSTF